MFNTSGSDAVFTPSAALDHFREYRIQIGTGITDLSGNFLDVSSETSFETLGNVVISPADPEGMILISGGRFMMGADSQTDSDAEANEGPVHSDILKGPFYIRAIMRSRSGNTRPVSTRADAPSPVQEPTLTT